MPSSFVNRIRVIAHFNALFSESRGPHLHTCSHDLKRRSILGSFSLWTWRVCRLLTCPTGSLASRARSRAALLLVSFPSQGGFELCFLARWHEERMFLSVLDNLFGHDLPLEPPQSALNGFTRVNIHYCHLFLQSCFQSFSSRSFRTHIKHAPQYQGQARMENPANSSRYSRGSPLPM